MKSGDHGNSHFAEEIAPVASAPGPFLLRCTVTLGTHRHRQARNTMPFSGGVAPQWGASVLISSPGLSFFIARAYGRLPMAYYWLTPPSRAVFFLSVLLAVLALLVRYAHIAIPVVSHYPFETLLVGFLLLLAGNLFKGF
jgi:hypothetical protein